MLLDPIVLERESEQEIGQTGVRGQQHLLRGTGHAIAASPGPHQSARQQHRSRSECGAYGECIPRVRCQQTHRQIRRGQLSGDIVVEIGVQSLVARIDPGSRGDQEQERIQP